MVLSIDLAFLGIAILAGLFVMIRYNPPLYLKLLTITLIINFIIDTTATILLLNGYYTNDLYNIYNIFYFELYMVIIYSIVKSTRAKRIMFNLMLGFAIVGIVNLLSIQWFQSFQSITFSVGCLLIVSFCIYYFLELFQRPTSVKLVYEPAFWLTSGLLFYYCFIFPMVSVMNFFGNDVSVRIVNIYYAITVIINVLLYSLFIIAFICRVKIKNYTS